MKIEVVANKLSETDPETGQHYLVGKGDALTVSDAFGRRLCDRGWAKDATGAYESAPFTPGAARLRPDPLKVTPKKKGG